MNKLQARKLIESYVQDHPEKNLNQCYKCLNELGISRATVYRVKKAAREG